MVLIKLYAAYGPVTLLVVDMLLLGKDKLRLFLLMMKMILVGVVKGD